MSDRTEATALDVDCSRCCGGGCEWCHNTGHAHVLMLASDADKLDAVVRLLAIEDDCCTPAEAISLTGRALFQERRERAAKLWREIEPAQFCLDVWHFENITRVDFEERSINVCGTVACALGWLGVRQIDDWYIEDGAPRRCSQDAFYNAYYHAANYFSLTLHDTFCLFSSTAAHSAYGVTGKFVTGAMVADALLKTPFECA